MSSSQILELPCLGRHFRLGTLYNCHNHCLISDFLIPEDVLSSKVKTVKSDIRNPPQINVISEEKNTSNLSALRSSSNSFKLGVITGLVKEKSGAGEYFDDRKSLSNIARISLSYRQETEITKLDINDIESNFISFPTSKATHVVVGIIHGREAFFVFDKSIDPDTSQEEVDKEYQELQTLMKRMRSNSEQLFLDEKDKVKMNCSFYGEFLTQIDTSNFDDAYEVFQKIIKNSETNLKTIPLQAHLLPLANFDNCALNVGKEISPSVSETILEIIHELHLIIMESSCFMQNICCKQFEGLFLQVNQFSQFIKQYQSQLQSNISAALPKVCSGEVEENQLSELIISHQASPFSFMILSGWLKSKEKESKHLDQHLDFLKKKGLEVINSLDKLNSIVDGIEFDNIVSLEFTIFEQTDVLLEHMSTYLSSQSSHTLDISTKSWLENETSKKELRSIVKKFYTIVTSPSDPQETKFIVSTRSKFKHSKEVAVIVKYTEGDPIMLCKTSPPGVPNFRELTYESVCVYWEKPQSGAENVEAYIVSHQSDDDQWKTQEIDGKQTCATIENLREDTQYKFKVQAKTKSGKSEESKESTIKTQPAPKAPSQPGQPLCYEPTHESIHLEWTKPDEGAHLVTQYVVSYNESIGSKNQWKEVETGSVTEEFTIHELQPETKYQFKVFAKYESILSAPSEASLLTSTTKKPLALHVRDTMSSCVTNGIPAFYQLKRVFTLTDEERRIAKCSIGDMPRRQLYREKVILLVGATGSGKSTLINAIANYIFDVKWEHKFRFQIIPDEKEKSQAHSQTEWITAYTFHWQNGFPIDYSLTVVDTPGFGDTRGLERDHHITTQIKEFFGLNNGILHLDDVGFVIQASQARLTATQKYIFDSILSIFGADMKHNISIMATFADGGKPQVADAIKEAEIPHSKCFCLNNSALYFQENSCDDFDSAISKLFWDMGVKSLQQYFAHMKRALPVSLQLTCEVLNKRHHLEAILEGLNKDIDKGLRKMEELRQEERILQQHQEDILKNKNFKYKVKVVKDKRVDLPVGEHVTHCLTCNRTCHYPCCIPNDGEKYNCFAMKNQGKPSMAVCGVCPGKCSWNCHINHPYRIEQYEDIETRTSDNLKKRYQKAIDGKNKHEAMVTNLEEEVKIMFCNFIDNVRLVCEIIHNLDEIALRKSPLTDVDYLDILIETEKIEKREGYLDRIGYFERAKQTANFLKALKTQGQLPDPKLETKEGRNLWTKIWKSIRECCSDMIEVIQNDQYALPLPSFPSFPIC